MTQNIPKGILVYMTARTDVHSPANLVTEDYEYEFAFDNGAPGFLVGVDMDWWRSITNWPTVTRDRGIHQCHHCGARIRYVALLKYVPTGEHIAVGETCLENRFERATAEFQRLRKQAELDRKAMRIKTEAEAFVAGLKGDAKLALARDAVITEIFPFIEAGSYADFTIRDISRKVWTYYGNASERQVAFVEKLVREARERAEAKARIDAERAAEVRIPAPTGRVTFDGLVVSRKWKDSDYGGSYKLTIKVDDAERGGIWLVWVSEPSKLTCERGDMIQMTATLTRSDRDVSFAFGKRPSKTTVLSSGNTVPENLEFPDALA